MALEQVAVLVAVEKMSGVMVMAEVWMDRALTAMGKAMDENVVEVTIAIDPKIHYDAASQRGLRHCQSVVA